jgi:hypothetical protein
MTFADYAMAENTVVKNLVGGKVDISSRQRNVYRLVVRRG